MKFIPYPELKKLNQKNYEKFLNSTKSFKQLSDYTEKYSTISFLIYEQFKVKLKNKKINFLLFDINCFMVFNDKYGHKEGDKLLEKIISILENNNNGIFSRIAGDDFLVITDENVSTLHEKIKKEIIDKYNITIGFINLEIENSGNSYPDISSYVEILDRIMYLYKFHGYHRKNFFIEIKNIENS